MATNEPRPSDRASELTDEAPVADVPALYLDLLMNILTRYIVISEEAWDVGISHFGWERDTSMKGRVKSAIRWVLARRGMRLIRTGGSPELRERGEDWPLTAETMVGLRRLENVRDCIEAILRDGVEGDLIETGVWRGGCSIFMRAVLAAHSDTTRVVWLADSFSGLAEPDFVTHPHEFEVDLSVYDELAVGIDVVKKNFRKYGLLDDQVRFLPGWFKDTLPEAPIDKLSLIRLDGDYYESTMTALTALYPKLSPGGFVIVDDYQIDACRRAVADFLGSVGETPHLQPIDDSSVFWQRI
jgi:O-methyltransferase